MKDLVTWKDLRRMADDALANSKPGDSWPHILDEVARAWGKNLDSLMECQRMSNVLVDEQALAQLTAELSITKQHLAEAREALAEVDGEFDDDDGYWWTVWKHRHAAALKAAREQS